MTIQGPQRTPRQAQGAAPPGEREKKCAGFFFCCGDEGRGGETAIPTKYKIKTNILGSTWPKLLGLGGFGSLKVRRGKNAVKDEGGGLYPRRWTDNEIVVKKIKGGGG